MDIASIAGGLPMTETKRLRIGDQVLASGVEARVTGIELLPGQNETDGGISIDEVPWYCVDRIVVDLDNGRWAHGSQIRPLDKDRKEDEPHEYHQQ